MGDGRPPRRIGARGRRASPIPASRPCHNPFCTLPPFCPYRKQLGRPWRLFAVTPVGARRGRGAGAPTAAPTAARHASDEGKGAGRE
jgi:hypothetical protein